VALVSAGSFVFSEKVNMVVTKAHCRFGLAFFNNWIKSPIKTYLNCEPWKTQFKLHKIIHTKSYANNGCFIQRHTLKAHYLMLCQHFVYVVGY
jgi:hypothetical protein